MITKLHEQAHGNDHASDIWREETRIVDDLENRGRIVLLKSRLVKSFAAIPQRMIHVNQHVAVHYAFGIDQGNATEKFFGISVSDYIRDSGSLMVFILLNGS